jgi:hypothetical protein
MPTALLEMVGTRSDAHSRDPLALPTQKFSIQFSNSQTVMANRRAHSRIPEPSLRGALATKQSIAPQGSKKVWIASRSLSSGGASRRPVGSQ